MHVREGVQLALHQIRTEKLKTAFSLLGVVLGVSFLILVVTVVEGLDRYVREDFTTTPTPRSGGRDSAGHSSASTTPK